MIVFRMMIVIILIPQLSKLCQGLRAIFIDVGNKILFHRLCI